MIKLFQEFIKESNDLFVPRNLDDRNDRFFRNLQRKLDFCDGFWEGDLNLEQMEIPSWFKITDNLNIHGEFDLAYSDISKLPKNLQCENLLLNNCKNVKELPEGLKVKYTINLRESSIKELPKNLQCQHLVLFYCQNIKELPEGLKVEYLYIRNSSLTIEYCIQMKQEGKISYNILV